MTEHLIAKLVTAIAGIGMIAAAAMPDDLMPFSTEHVEAWARFGVAGGCLLIMVIGILYTVPKMARDHREALNEAHATHERTINRICESHAGSMREMRAEQREDGLNLGKQLDRLTDAFTSVREAIHDEGKKNREAMREKRT